MNLKHIVSNDLNIVYFDNSFVLSRKSTWTKFKAKEKKTKSDIEINRSIINEEQLDNTIYVGLLATVFLIESDKNEDDQRFCSSLTCFLSIYFRTCIENAKTLTLQ